MASQHEIPAHRRPALVALVLLGGTAGAACRHGVAVLSGGADWPAGTFAANVVGSFALGLLLEALLRHGPDLGGRRGARLLLGTGFLGAFTTYSSFAVETIELADAGRPGTAGAYVLASLACGLVAGGLGVLAGGALVRRREAR